ncbi:hypothetical protein GW915_13155 [bacterium]|nr:hypothetical protein [bacterium]
MGGSKSRGSLRDFRVDSISGSSEISSSVSSVKSSLQQQDRHVLPQQKTAMRQMPTSTVQEWDHDDSGLDQSKLWKAWEEDLEITRSNAPAAYEAAISAETKVAPQMQSTRIGTSAPEVPPLPPREKEAEKPQKRNLPWAADLALTERRMERRGEVEYSNSFKKQELLKIQTSEYIRVLRAEFSRNIDMFNEARQSGAHAAHLYNISGTEDDFMLFRNGVKLVVSGQRSGRILFVFNQFLGQVFAPNQNPQVELEAQWGPFDRLFWSYRGERIQVQDVVRYFVSEFIRQSYK